MMTNLDIAHRRLHNQQIAGMRFDKPSEVVASLGAMQAQDYLGALWAIGLRLPNATEADIEQALAERAIVRTWPMRGTLHFVAAADVRWIIELLAPRIIAGSAHRYRQLALDDATFARSRELFANALQGGKQLSREAMFALLEAAQISTAGQRGFHILGRLAQEGLICFGARQGKQQTFVLLDEWAPNAKRLARDEALAELAKRYFTGHGPATLQDFVWWSGLKVSDAKAGLDMVAAQLTEEGMNGQRYWMAQAAPASHHISPTAYLLPGFDEYMLGYTDRSAALDPQHVQKIQPGKNGMFSSTIVIDGRIVGTWKRTIKKKAVVIAATPFVPPTTAENDAIAAAARRYGEFLGMPVVLS
jgi:hypothetical protein